MPQLYLKLKLQKEKTICREKKMGIKSLEMMILLMRYWCVKRNSIEKSHLGMAKIVENLKCSYNMFRSFSNQYRLQWFYSKSDGVIFCNKSGNDYILCLCTGFIVFHI